MGVYGVFWKNINSIKTSKIIPAASTKQQKNRSNRRFLVFLHVFYTILFKIDIARSSSRG